MTTRNKMIALVILILAVVFAKGLIFGGGARSAKLAVTFDPNGIFRVIRIVSHDDTAVTITRVVINGKEGDRDCDIVPETEAEKNRPKNGLEALIPASPLPATLSLGGSVSVIASAVCNNPVKAEIITEDGSDTTYEFN